MIDLITSLVDIDEDYVLEVIAHDNHLYEVRVKSANYDYEVTSIYTKDLYNFYSKLEEHFRD